MSRSASVPRRDALRAGTAATLAAARALAPTLFAGCSLGIPPRPKTVTIGMLHSQTGPLSISATSLRDVELHAIEQINAAGGLLGRQVVARAPDTRSRVEVFPKRARQLLDEGVVALFGCWTSSSRKAVLPLVEAAKTMLYYPVQYEGNESSPYCVYGGMVPNQQILPALDWLAGVGGGLRKKLFLIGSDYVFPRTANFVAKKALKAKGRELQVVGEEYLPLGERDFSGIVARLLDSGADCVLNTVNGDSNIGLFAALAAAKVDPAEIPVVSTSIAEDELRKLLPEQVKGHYGTCCYFQSLDTPANRLWIDTFRREFGYDRVTDDPMEPAWCLIHFWKQAVEKAGSFDTEAIRQVFRDGLVFDGPSGRIRLDPKTQHTTKYFRLGRIRRDRQFDIVQSSPEPIEPDPYPAIAFPGWSVDWTKTGVTRGTEVDIHGDV